MATTISHGHVDFSAMEKSEISKTLYGQIQWEELLRSGVFLQHRDHQLLERAQSNLSVVLDNPQDAKEFVSMLIKIAENCTTNLVVQQYVFTRMEEILGLSVDATGDTDSDAFGMKHARLFTVDGKRLADNCFVRALNFSDIYLQRSVSLTFAALLTICDGNVNGLLNWITTKLASNSNGVWDMALPSLGVLTRSQSARAALLTSNIVHTIVNILKRIGANGNSQHQYELAFILWSLSLGETDVEPYLISGAIPTIVDLLSSSSTRKVTRVSIATLKNLAITEKDQILNEMYTAGLLRIVDNLQGSHVVKHMNDVDVEQDFKTLVETLHRNHRELSTFERWSTEVNSCSLRWGIVHTEKFWKENAKFVEQDNFNLLKSLIALLHSADPTVVCVALYDIGEFTRFYPNGRVVVSRLGAKDIIMTMMSHEDPDIQRQVLQCISKIMVTNWDHLR